MLAFFCCKWQALTGAKMTLCPGADCAIKKIPILVSEIKKYHPLIYHP